MRHLVLLLTAALLVASVVSAEATFQFYGTDFEGQTGPEWSNPKTDTSPIGGRRFLGQFCNDTVTLRLDNLPAHDRAILRIDLNIIRSWDGNDNYWGPDIWTAFVSDGPILLNTTFGQYPYCPGQAYPGSYPGGQWASRTGAVENNSLGYTFTNEWMTNAPMDSVYRLHFDFPHSANQLIISFRGSGLQALADESWGLDNVGVWLTPIPEPSGIFALLCGIAGFGSACRRRQA